MLWGCTEKAKQKVELEGRVLERCPLRIFLDDPDDMAEIVWYYTAYKRGQLPISGGLLDQPAKLMECFKVIDGAVGTIERHKEAEAEADRRRKAAANARRGR